MVTLYFRTVFIYIFLIITMRLMGKRQLGDLQVSELIITFMLSELAATPISNREIPILYALLPILLLLSIEVIVSFASTRCNTLKKLLNGSPAILVNKGKLSRRALSDNRMEVDELLSELRQKGFASLDEVDYAILEENGRLSVFPVPKYAPVTCGDMQLSPTRKGIAHPLIVDGKIIERELDRCRKDKAWLEKQLQKRKTQPEKVFLLTLDDAGGVVCLLREDI
ncbi:MAG: DUF421 domain-containing protein [Clostridia bacterium]|nr:DUF421 domain-containing protein [Clostridia bacterium]